MNWKAIMKRRSLFLSLVLSVFCWVEPGYGMEFNACFPCLESLVDGATLIVVAVPYCCACGCGLATCLTCAVHLITSLDPTDEDQTIPDDRLPRRCACCKQFEASESGMIRFACGHLFHGRCVAASLQNKQHTCPACFDHTKST